MQHIVTKMILEYCSGHTNGVEGDSRIAVFPADFTTEAAALGGRVRTTGGGFSVVEPVLETPADLRRLPPLDEQPPVKRALEHIARAPAGKIPLLQANAPYSALAPLVPPALWCRWLVKNSGDILAALEHITAGLAAYMNAAFACGARILSLADPFASFAALGADRYRVFAAKPLARLLATLHKTAPPGSIIHLCPQSSRPLEHDGLLKSRPRPAAGPPAAYIDLLSALAPQAVLLLGHQCIHTKEAGSLVELELV
jgi:uroporphyrinogen-III decarboxylase